MTAESPEGLITLSGDSGQQARSVLQYGSVNRFYRGSYNIYKAYIYRRLGFKPEVSGCPRTLPGPTLMSGRAAGKSVKEEMAQRPGPRVRG
jgi:hypothetical protein